MDLGVKRPNLSADAEVDYEVLKPNIHQVRLLGKDKEEVVEGGPEDKPRGVACIKDVLCKLLMKFPDQFLFLRQ